MFEASGPSVGSISSPHSSLISRQPQLQGCPGSKTVLKSAQRMELDSLDESKDNDITLDLRAPVRVFFQVELSYTLLGWKVKSTVLLVL